MKTFEDVIEKSPAENSIFKVNINPIRLGLVFYKVVDDLAVAFNYSNYCAT